MKKSTFSLFRIGAFILMAGILGLTWWYTRALWNVSEGVKPTKNYTPQVRYPPKVSPVPPVNHTQYFPCAEVFPGRWVGCNMIH